MKADLGKIASPVFKELIFEDFLPLTKSAACLIKAVVLFLTSTGLNLGTLWAFITCSDLVWFWFDIELVMFVSDFEHLKGFIFACSSNFNAACLLFSLAASIFFLIVLSS